MTRHSTINRAIKVGIPAFSACCVCVVSAIADTVVTFEQVSSPLGLCGQEQILPTGLSVSTLTAPSPSQGYRFINWTVNGIEQRDVVGRSVNPSQPFLLLEETTAVAHYLLESQDDNTNTVPDWWEFEFFGSLVSNACSDVDGDGFDLAEEYRRDYHPSITNEIRDGGFSLVLSSASRVIVDTTLSTYIRQSDPLGLISATDQVMSNGTSIAVADVYGVNSGYSFAFWTLNGEPQRDVSGRALSAFEFILQSNTTAVAHYVPTSQDGDGDGIPDWYELNMYGTTNLNAGDDSDGDDFDLAEEYRRDYHPSVNNEIRDGGFSLVLSPASRVIVDVTLSEYRRQSDPLGLLASTDQVLSNGTPIAVADVYGVNSGYSFAFWTLNGEAQRDVAGRALGAFEFVLQSNTTAIAHYVPTSQDGDGDGVPDWYELNLYGTTNLTASSDSDGDGFDLAEEYRRDYHPSIVNEIRDGGFSLVLSLPVTVNLQFFLRVPHTLVNGVFQPFFSKDTSVTGLFSIVSNSHPALGDWDGDGDLDLFVGGSNGVMRVFENGGSPTVMNWVERTSNFTAVADCWTNILNPAPSLGDWSGDGLADLAVGGGTGVVWLVASPGSWEGDALTGTLRTNLNTGAEMAVPAFLDADGDGWADLLVLTETGLVQCYTNTHVVACPYAGPPLTTDLLGTPVPDARGISTADVNGDGVTDVLVSDESGNIWEFHGGIGTYTLKSKIYGGTFNGFAQRLTITAGDIDGDGDTDIIGGYAQGGLVYLQNPDPHLIVSPPTVTVMPGDALTVRALNNTGEVLWSLIQNSSGGSIDLNTGEYVAGPAGGVMDVVEGVDSVGLSGRSYINVISPEDVARSGKAVIIAGRRSLDDPLWKATDYLADRGYNTLRYRGFSKENIQYLSPIPGRDKDGNGLADDIDLESTYANAATTFTHWVNDAGRLFVYLVDHGYDSSGSASFSLNPSERLTAYELDVWLDALQDQANIDVVVFIDCCYAGSFLDELTYEGPAKRVVIASSDDRQAAWFIADGLVSFSDAFFGAVMLGLDVRQVFELASGAMATYQQAWMDDNCDGVYNSADGPVAAEMIIGSGVFAGKDIPQIGRVPGNQVLTGETVVQLEADEVVSAYPIARVWCMIVPPDHEPDPHNPVASLSELDLVYDSATGSYRAQYNGFSQLGIYKVIYYAKDIWGSVSLPRQSWVTQTAYDERVVLVTGVALGDPAGGAVRHVMTLAYQTFLSRRISAEQILVLSPDAGVDLDKDGMGDVDGPALFDGLATAITNWAAGADKLTVFLVGKSQDGDFQLVDDELVSGADLDGWLDGFQAGDGEVIVVADFNGSGSLLPALQATGTQDRIIVTSTKPGNSSVMSNGGLVSFAQHFLMGVFNGHNVWASFEDARGAIRRQTGKSRQQAQLDDNGDGIYDKTDGEVAQTRYIGTAFATGTDAPSIGLAMPDTAVACTNALTLWVSEVTSMAGVSNVWCVITPPDYDGTGDLPETDLAWNLETERYEVNYDGFTQPGAYVCTFMAADVEGTVSAVVQSEVITVDAFEPDDTPSQASLYVGHSQTHTFHIDSDEDWVRLYAVSNFNYDISAEPVSLGLDLVIHLYRELPDGSLDLIESVDLGGDGVGELTWLDFPEEGFYYVRISPYIDEGAEDNLGAYELSITIPSASDTSVLIVLGVDDVAAGALPEGSSATVLGKGTKFFNGSMSAVFTGLANGTYLVTVPPPEHFIPREDPVTPGQVQSLTNRFYANPRQVSVSGGWYMAGFEMLPTVGVTSGIVRDAWTYAVLEGAQIAFTATSGSLAGTVVDGGIMLTNYRTNWFSGADGRIPSDIMLGACDWSLSVSLANYETCVRAGAVGNLLAGGKTDLGTVLLVPQDANANQLADDWEARYFPGGGAMPGNDPDGDGHDNLTEYLAGTDPTNSLSVFEIVEMYQTAQTEFALKWTGANNRVYRVFWSDTLGAWPSEQSVLVSGTNAWHDKMAPRMPMRFYRVVIEIPPFP